MAEPEIQHKNAPQEDLHPFARISEVNPGAIGAYQGWFNPVNGALKVRNIDDNGWDDVNAFPTYHLAQFGAVSEDVDADFDNTDAFQAALDAIYASNGGTLFLPEDKIYRIYDLATKNFTGGHAGLIRIMGGKIRLVQAGAATPRIEIENASGGLIWDSLVFYGENEESKVDVIGYGLRVYGAPFCVFKNLAIKSVLSNNPTESDEIGLIHLESCANVYIEIDSEGSVGKGSALILLKNCHNATLYSPYIVDVNGDPNAFSSKTGDEDLDGRCWIKVRNIDDEETENQNDKVRSRVIVIGGYLDEGVNIGIDAKNVEFLQVNGTHINTYVLGGGAGIKLDNVKNTRVTGSSFVDLNENSSKAIEATGGSRATHSIIVDQCTVGNDAGEVTHDNYKVQILNSPDVRCTDKFALSAVQTADQNFVSSAVLADTALIIKHVEAGKTYAVRACLLIHNGAGYTNHAFGGTATLTDFAAEYKSHKAETPTEDDLGKRITTHTTTYGADSKYNATGTVYVCYIDGFIKVNAGGTFLIQMAQGGSNADASKMLKGSYLVLTEVK